MQHCAQRIMSAQHLCACPGPPLLLQGTHIRQAQPTRHSASQLDVAAVTFAVQRLHAGCCGVLRTCRRLGYTACRSSLPLLLLLLLLLMVLCRGPRCSVVPACCAKEGDAVLGQTHQRMCIMHARQVPAANTPADTCMHATRSRFSWSGMWSTALWCAGFRGSQPGGRLASKSLFWRTPGQAHRCWVDIIVCVLCCAVLCWLQGQPARR